MKTGNHNGKREAIIVADFFEIGKEDLDMELAAGGEHMSDKRITETAINRPGLALTGFYEYFAWKRIQIFGFAEYKYLDSLSAAERKKRLEDFFASKIPCVVVARGKKVMPEMIDLSEEYSIPVFRTKMVTKHFINAATILMEDITSPRIKMQGTMVEIMGIGVLIEGQPGIGKSDTALSLVRKGAALVADDITMVRMDSSGSLIGSPVNVTRYHMEIKGVGIIHVPSLFGVASVRGEKALDMIVTLCHPKGGKSDNIQIENEVPTREVMGVEIPSITISVIPGRDIANVVEVAALDYKLRQLGHDAAKELDERLIKQMSKG